MNAINKIMGYPSGLYKQQYFFLIFKDKILNQSTIWTLAMPKAPRIPKQARIQPEWAWRNVIYDERSDLFRWYTSILCDIGSKMIIREW